MKICALCGEAKPAGLPLHGKFICEDCSIAISVLTKCGEMEKTSCPLRMNRILVTGGAGFIGYNLTHFLESPIILDWKEPTSLTRKKAYIQHDIRKPIENKLLPEIKGVVHLAALTGKQECAKNPKLATEINVEGTRNILEYCRQTDIEHLVFSSTCAAYCEKETHYTQTKIKGEELCREYHEKYGINTVVLRLANVYGPHFQLKQKLTVIHKFILKAILGEPLPVDHVHDVCDAMLRALNHNDHGIFFIGTGIETSINSLAQLIQNLTMKLYGRKVRIKHVPMPKWREKALRVSIPTEETEKKLGWKPTIPLEKGIERLISLDW